MSRVHKCSHEHQNKRTCNLLRCQCANSKFICTLFSGFQTKSGGTLGFCDVVPGVPQRFHLPRSKLEFYFHYFHSKINKLIFNFKTLLAALVQFSATKYILWIFLYQTIQFCIENSHGQLVDVEEVSLWN